MHTLRWLFAFVICILPARAATFGRIVPLVGGASDIALDEGRGRLYLTSSLQNLIQVYSIQRQTFLSTVPTDQTPLSSALSRDGKFLYVTCYDSAALDVIDLDTLAVVTRVSLPARPEGVAVGSDGRVLISTTGSGTNGAANVLLLYDPSPNATVPLTNISVVPAAPTPPTLPPPSGRPFLASHSQLAATRDGSLVVGVNVPGAGSPTVFVYEAASDTVLRSRIVAGSSTVLSISDDGTRFTCGPNLFETATLQILATVNAANAPYPITVAAGASFNTQSAQGGGVFSPDGQTLYAAFDISPVQNPPAPANVSQLMLNDPDNLLIRMGLQLPENLSGKMVISADGTNIYALSDSGFTILPTGTISRSPLAVPSATVTLLTKDQCGVTSQTSSATVAINNAGSGRVTATAQLLQIAGQTNSSPATAPTVRPSQSGSGPQFAFGFNAAAARGLGTITPPHDFVIQSPEAINIPNRVRVYENSRDAEATGTVIPIPVAGAAGEAFPDIVFDQARQRLYIANLGLNRVEVFDTQQQAFLAPIKVGQMPSALALTPDGNTLYVANSGSENISIIDPDKLQTVGRVSFPPIPFNSNLALMTPRLIAAGLSGPLILMSNGSLWNVVGNTAVPRGVSRLLGQTAAGLPVAIPIPSSMAATPAGEYILLVTATGVADLYDATVDDWVASRQVFTAATQTGYIGPVAAGPKGQYFVVNGTVLNSALVPAGSPNSRLISALAPMANNTFAIFSPPAVTGVNTVPATAPVVQIMNATTGGSTLQVNALEGPITQVAGAARVSISGRTMAIDSANAIAYVITTSGLSIIPLTPPAAAGRPVPNQNGAVNLGSFQKPVAPNGLLSIFGQNLGASELAGSMLLPTMLGGTCVTLNNIALPLFMASPTQINAQIPPDLAAGSYPLIVRSIANHIAAAPQSLTVSKYAPAVLVPTAGQIALVHADGSFVNKDNPANRDEHLTMYAVGLGPTTGGAVTAGAPSPSSPLAVTGTVEVFFGDPSYKQAGIIVDWSGLAPGFVGLYQLNLRVPGFHISGDALPVTIRIGSVNSPTTGPVVPTVSVN
jgi:uncharacterized protein (TIGR03437 family)